MEVPPRLRIEASKEGKVSSGKVFDTGGLCLLAMSGNELLDEALKEYDGPVPALVGARGVAEGVLHAAGCCERFQKEIYV